MSDDLIHDRASIRAGWDDDDPDVTRIVRRVGAALNSGRDNAVVEVVLDEVAKASGPLTDDEMVAELVKRGVLKGDFRNLRPCGCRAGMPARMCCDHDAPTTIRLRHVTDWREARS